MERVKHAIRSAYGYTDAQILEHIMAYGSEWAESAYRMIREDENARLQALVSIFPVARTPQDKKGGRAMLKYTKSLRRSIERAYAPWIEQRRVDEIRDRLSKPPSSVMYDEDGNVVDPRKMSVM